MTAPSELDREVKRYNRCLFANYFVVNKVQLFHYNEQETFVANAW